MQLSNHLRAGGKPNIDSSTTARHLDSITFWRDAYTKSEAEAIKLLDRIYDLEQRNEALLSRTAASSSTSSLNLTPTKRKGRSEDQLGVLRGRKQPKITRVETGRGKPAVANAKEKDLVFSDDGAQGKHTNNRQEVR